MCSLRSACEKLTSSAKATKSKAGQPITAGSG